MNNVKNMSRKRYLEVKEEKDRRLGTERMEEFLEMMRNAK